MSCWSYILLFLLCLGFGDDSDSLYYNLRMVFYLFLDFSRRFFLGNLETEICLFWGQLWGHAAPHKGPYDSWTMSKAAPEPPCVRGSGSHGTLHMPADRGHGKRPGSEHRLAEPSSRSRSRSRGQLSFSPAELPPRRLGAAAGIKVQSRGPGQGVNILGSFSLRLNFVFDRCILHLEQHLAQRRIKYLPFHRVLLITCYIEARSPHALCSMWRLVQGFHK